MDLNDDDGDWVPATHVENMILAGFVIFVIAMTIVAIKLW